MIKQAEQKKIVLVTGASRGIGLAAAEAFSEAGYAVVMNARNEERLFSEAERLCARGLSCVPVAGDVSDMEFVRTLFARIDELSAKLLGKNEGHALDILINNAGISHIGLLQDMTPAEWNALIGINLTSVFNTCHEAILRMLKNHRGSILNISSVWGVCGASCEAAYSASKGGVNALTKALAKELAPSGISVNAVACGAVDTEMNGHLNAEERAALEAEIPAGRMAEPAEAAKLLLKLSEAGPYLTGQIIGFDGAWI